MPPADSGTLGRDEAAVLVLQGGGALGAYQAGVFEELSENGIAPRWLAGVSIGAINAAIIAGNPPGKRAEALRHFWLAASSKLRGRPLTNGGPFHQAFNEASAFLAAAWGVPGFFKPRPVSPLFLPDGSPGALSFYDTGPLRETLEALIDFDRLNGGEMRVSLGAVNIRTGNYVYFDTKRDRIGPEHVMASGALPPGLPPVTIEGETYWDGGIVSNTPLQIVLDETPSCNLCVFQVDVFSASGELPKTIFDVYEREKEIRYSSRTRLNTDVFTREQRRRQATARLLEKLPKELVETEDARFLRSLVPQYGISIVHLIYRRQPYESFSFDYEFSRVSVDEHWKAGRIAVADTLRNPRWKTHKAGPGDVEILDLSKPHHDTETTSGVERNSKRPKKLEKGALQ